LAGGRLSDITLDVSENLYIRLTIKNMKSFAKICLVLVTAVTMAAFTTLAQTNTAPAGTNQPPAPAKPKAKRYVGKIAGVDNDAKTISITLASGDSQTLHITSKTRIRKDGQPATLADATVGLRAVGAEHQDDSGDWVATTVNIGEAKPKAATPPAATPPPAANPRSVDPDAAPNRAN
jgi:hypothetical protein